MPTTPKRAAKKPTATTNEPHYVVSLTIADKTWTGEGATLTDALDALPKPEKLMHKGDLAIVEHRDGVERRNTIHFIPSQLKRLFVKKSILNVRVKSLMLGLR